MLKGEAKKEQDYHEHPLFNGQYHQALWLYVWASGDTNGEIPRDASMVCAVCGKVKAG